MTGPVVDLLNAVDWVVPDLDAAHTRLVELFPELRPTGELHLAEHEFTTVFLRGSAPLTAAPTRVQLVTLTEGGAGADTCSRAPFGPMQQAQGLARGQRVHGTVVAVRNFDESLAWLRARDVPVFVERECEHLNYRRAWLGWSNDGRRRIEGIDGGLFLELIPIEAFPRSVPDSVANAQAASGTALRVAARTHLVADLDEAIRQLQCHVGLAPMVRYEDELLGVRAARYVFRHPGGADLILAQTEVDGPAARELRRSGPGVYLTTFACADLAAATSRASAAGATVVARSRSGQPRVVLADRTADVHFELTQGGAHAG